MKLSTTFIVATAVGTALNIGACNRKDDSGYRQKEPAAITGDALRTAVPVDDQPICETHKAPKAACYFCNASLRDPDRLWCAEHNRYEDRCFICHPEAQDASRLYCAEHGLYEDECYICHPELNNNAGAAPARSSTSAAQCKEHRVPEIECGICHPELLSRIQPGEGLKIRFESLQSAEKAGITTTLPDSAFAEGLSFSARTGFNENSSAIVLARFAGIVVAVNADLGTTVKKGQVLATVSSPEFTHLIAEFRSTSNDARIHESEYLREKELFEKKVASRQELDNAAALFTRARNTSDALRQQLTSAGLTPENVSGILEQEDLSAGFAIRAPVTGTVIRRSVATGQSVSAETPVATIVDLSTLWIHVAVPQAAGEPLVSGASLKITFDGNAFFPAIINWVSPEVDPASGTIQVRAEMKNPENRFRSGVFCRAFPGGKPAGQLFTVPAGAVASIDGFDVVFIKAAPDLYEARRIVLDGIIDGRAIVPVGIKKGDKVVTGGTFVVKSEFLKSRLGAGCVDE